MFFPDIGIIYRCVGRVSQELCSSQTHSEYSCHGGDAFSRFPPTCRDGNVHLKAWVLSQQHFVTERRRWELEMNFLLLLDHISGQVYYFVPACVSGCGCVRVLFMNHWLLLQGKRLCKSSRNRMRSYHNNEFQIKRLWKNKEGRYGLYSYETPVFALYI